MIEVSDNDIEYYERKVMRLEQDIGILQEELNRVRLKLRSAEDYEIKYRILIKNNEVDLQRVKIQIVKAEEIKCREKVAEALRENDQRWAQVKQSLVQEIQNEANEKIQRLENDLQISNRKLKDISQKKEEMQLFSFKIRKFEKQNAALELQLANIKKICEKQKLDELAALRNQLNTGFRERLAAERQSHEARISSLAKKLTEAQMQDNFELNMPDLSNAELVALRDLYAATKTSHQKEITEFQDIILRKNAEIKSLLRELSEREQQFQEIFTNKSKEVSKLEEEITKIRKQHQEQILELDRRFTATKESETAALKEQLKGLADLCKEKESEMSKQAQQCSQQIQSYVQRSKEDISRANEQRERSQKAAGELAQKLKEKQEKILQLTSQINREKSKQLHSNGEDAGDYQNGILFLERQLRRSQQKIQDKNRLYSKLENDLQIYRKEAQAEIARLHLQLKQERKQSEEKLNGLQNQLHDLIDQLATKTKEMNQSKKLWISEKLSLQSELRSHAGQLEQLEADYTRLQQTRKQVELLLKTEREKGSHPAGRGEEGMKSIQADLEAIYREKQEHLLRKQEENRRVLNDELKKLNEKLNEVELENTTLKKAQQRLLSELECNKQNAKVDQERKVATVELQLARLNNIYQAFVNTQSSSFQQPPQNRLSLSRYDQQFRTPTTSK